jgi:hypothetical protein
MRRVCFLFAFFLVLVTALCPVPVRAAETFARYVPDGAVFYATTQDFERFWRGIEQSNFWATFTRLEIWEGADFSWYDDFREDFAANLGFELSTENVMAVFGKEFAVALYVEPGEDGQAGPKIEVFLVARMNPPDAVEEIVNKLLDRAKEEGGGDVMITAVEHDGTKVHTIKTKDDDPPIQLRWAMKEGVLITGVGNGVPRVESCLDCMAGTGSPLASSEEFSKLLGLARQDRGTFLSEMYFSMDKFQQLLAQLWEGQPELAPLANMLEAVAGTTTAMMSTTHLDRGLRIKAAIEPGPALDEMMALMRRTAPSAGTHMKYVRADALLYYGANSMPSLGELWPHVMKMYERTGTGIDEIINDAVEQIELALDIDFQTDLLDNVGTEFAVVLEGLDMEVGPFPFPKLTVLLQVNDKAKAQAFIDKVVSLIEETAPPEAGITVTEVTHQGAALKVVKVPVPFMQIELTPTIGIVENFLFISSGEPYAKATLDAARGGANLLNAPLYRSVGIPEKTNAVAFINMDELIKTGRTVTDWVVSMAEMQGAGEATKEQVDAIVLPLLECLSTLKAIAGYSIVTPEGTTAVYVIRVEDLPAN